MLLGLAPKLSYRNLTGIGGETGRITALALQERKGSTRTGDAV